MAIILPVEDKHPQFGKDCFVAPNATIVGDVVMGDNCSVWFSAVVRGDVNSIRLGNKVNVQDGAVIHATYQKTKRQLLEIIYPLAITLSFMDVR
jgi:carbonic anhydrase/acetyltransferase-like protein (isoleucine patch superfamily)